MATRIFWTDELIESQIKESMDALQIERMPTAEELKAIGKNNLHCAISKRGKYSGWAKRLGLGSKSCDTRTGQEYESIVSQMLQEQGFQVERMTTKHPYDLLVNGCTKVDVKVGKAYLLNGEWRTHTFNLSKRYASCDFYICVAVDEQDAIERVFVIPAHRVQIVCISLGKNSKYNKFLDKYESIRQHSGFMSEMF